MDRNTSVWFNLFCWDWKKFEGKPKSRNMCSCTSYQKRGRGTTALVKDRRHQKPKAIQNIFTEKEQTEKTAILGFVFFSECNDDRRNLEKTLRTGRRGRGSSCCGPGWHFVRCGGLSCLKHCRKEKVGAVWWSCSVTAPELCFRKIELLVSKWLAAQLSRGKRKTNAHWCGDGSKRLLSQMLRFPELGHWLIWTASHVAINFCHLWRVRVVLSTFLNRAVETGNNFLSYQVFITVQISLARILRGALSLHSAEENISLHCHAIYLGWYCLYLDLCQASENISLFQWLLSIILGLWLLKGWCLSRNSVVG